MQNRSFLAQKKGGGQLQCEICIVLATHSLCLAAAIRAPLPFAPSLPLLPSRPFNNIVRKTIIYLKMDAATLPTPPPIASTCTSYSPMQGPLSPHPILVTNVAQTCDPFWRCGCSLFSQPTCRKTLATLAGKYFIGHRHGPCRVRP